MWAVAQTSGRFVFHNGWFFRNTSAETSRKWFATNLLQLWFHLSRRDVTWTSYGLFGGFESCSCENKTKHSHYQTNGYGSKLGTPKLWMVNTKLDLQHRNPSRMLNSGNIFFTILIWFWIRFDDMNLICFEFGVMISIWFWFGFDTILIRFWYDFDMILIRFWYGSSELASKKETETAQG